MNEEREEGRRRSKAHQGLVEYVMEVTKIQGPVIDRFKNHSGKGRAVGFIHTAVRVGLRWWRNSSNRSSSSTGCILQNKETEINESPQLLPLSQDTVSTTNIYMPYGRLR